MSSSTQRPHSAVEIRHALAKFDVQIRQAIVEGDIRIVMRRIGREMVRKTLLFYDDDY